MEKNRIMERRFIEEYFPIKEISEISEKRKRSRYNNISSLHVWWARKPQESSRTTAYAALIPYDENNREKNKQFLIDLANSEEQKFYPTLKEARKKINKFYDGNIPKILDPFSGGGSIPYECSRLGCDVVALDYNPVAALILKATCEFPQKFSNDKLDNSFKSEIKENNLLQHLKKWQDWIFSQVESEIKILYPEHDGYTDIAFLWAHTLTCQNPKCSAEIPLIKQYWLSKKESMKVCLYPEVIKNSIKLKIVGDGYDKIPKTFDPNKGIVNRGKVVCPVCQFTSDADSTRKLFKNGLTSEKLIAIVSQKKSSTGKKYRIPSDKDHLEKQIQIMLEKKIQILSKDWEITPIPFENTPNGKGNGAERAFSLQNYGMNTWGDVFNSRQQLVHLTFCEKIRHAYNEMLKHGYDLEFAKAIIAILAMGFDRLVDFNSKLCMLNSNGGRGVVHTFGRIALHMTWVYAESNPFSPFGASWITACKKNEEWVKNATKYGNSECKVIQDSATQLPFEKNHFDAIITDPPYYDTIPYSYFSDFFYVWLKRAVGKIFPEFFVTPLTPKSDEIVEYHNTGIVDPKLNFEVLLKKSFFEINRVLKPDGIVIIVYAHKSTEGWETLINSILDSGLIVTAAWPISTEMGRRLRAQDSAALSSSIYMICRKWKKEPIGFYRDVKKELKEYLNRKLEQLWEEEVSGADFFISAIGSAIEVYGKYEKVVNDKDKQISVLKLLNDTRTIVTDYAINKVIKGEFSDEISQMTRFYILWRWAYGEAKVPFDSALRMAQSVGINIEREWNKGFILKDKEFIRIIGPDERTEKELSDSYDLIDILHKTLLLWKKGKKGTVDKFLEEKGYKNSEVFKRVAQAISESLHLESTEKKWLDGFLTGFKSDNSHGTNQSKLF
jgi:putative DNA methylase